MLSFLPHLIIFFVFSGSTTNHVYINLHYWWVCVTWSNFTFKIKRRVVGEKVVSFLLTTDDSDTATSLSKLLKGLVGTEMKSCVSNFGGRE
jgi:hypothetical protein